MRRKTANKKTKYDEDELVHMLRLLTGLDHDLVRFFAPLRREFRDSRLRSTLSPVLGKAISQLKLQKIETDQDARDVFMQSVIILLYSNIRKILE